MHGYYSREASAATYMDETVMGTINLDNPREKRLTANLLEAKPGYIIAFVGSFFYAAAAKPHPAPAADETLATAFNERSRHLTKTHRKNGLMGKQEVVVVS